MRTPIPLAAVTVLTALAAVLLVLNPSPIAARGTSGTPQQGSAPVTIVSPLPLPVDDVSRPAATPVQHNFVPGYDPYVVPAGKRLVIEFVSASCTTEGLGRIVAAYLTTSVGTHRMPHSFYPMLTGSTSDGVNIQVFSHSTRLYADPATEVVATVPSVGGLGSCTSLVFSGYLTNP